MADGLTRETAAHIVHAVWGTSQRSAASRGTAASIDGTTAVPMVRSVAPARVNGALHSGTELQPDCAMTASRDRDLQLTPGNAADASTGVHVTHVSAAASAATSAAGSAGAADSKILKRWRESRWRDYLRERPFPPDQIKTVGSILAKKAVLWNGGAGPAACAYYLSTYLESRDAAIGQLFSVHESDGLTREAASLVVQAMMEGRSDTARRRPTVASSSIAVAAAKAVPAKRESTPVTESCLTAADGSSVVPLLLPVAEHARGVSMVERATASAAPIASSSTAAVCAGEGAEPTPQPTPQCSRCPAPKGGQVLSMGACVELDGSEVLCALCHAAFGRTRPASRWRSRGFPTARVPLRSAPSVLKNASCRPRARRGSMQMSHASFTSKCKSRNEARRNVPVRVSARLTQQCP
jgi:hypothetical protein